MHNVPLGVADVPHPASGTDRLDAREMSWAEAMRAERRGDTVAYARLLEEITPLLRRLVRYRLAQMGLNTHETEDLVQDVLMGLHTKRHTWDENRAFLPWFYAITRYKLVDSARRLRRETKRRADVTLEELEDWFQAPAEDLDRSALRVERHLANLSQTQRDVVRKLAIDGISVRAVAQHYGTSESAVRMTFHRALQRLMRTVTMTGLRAPRGGEA